MEAYDYTTARESRKAHHRAVADKHGIRGEWDCDEWGDLGNVERLHTEVAAQGKRVRKWLALVALLLAGILAALVLG